MKFDEMRFSTNFMHHETLMRGSLGNYMLIKLNYTKWHKAACEMKLIYGNRVLCLQLTRFEIILLGLRII